MPSLRSVAILANSASVPHKVPTRVVLRATLADPLPELSSCCEIRPCRRSGECLQQVSLDCRWAGQLFSCADEFMRERHASYGLVGWPC